MLSQFISAELPGLGDLDFSFPDGIHAIGRLDKDSEGLLILTTNKKVTRLLFLGERPHKRTYLVKVRYAVSQESVEALRSGVTIRVKGGVDYVTAPCDADIVDTPEGMFPNPYETKDHVPYTWLRMTLTEGKFHQVRKMTAATGHRCKRLIRESIDDLKLQDLLSGQVREIDEQYFFEMLHIQYEPVKG